MDNLSIIDPWKYCQPLATDPTILTTKEPFGVAALAEYACKAVILQRDYPAEIKRIMDNLTHGQIQKLNHLEKNQVQPDLKFSISNLLESKIFECENDAKIIAEDIGFINNIIKMVVPKTLSNYFWFHSIASNPRYHVDRKHIVRGAVVYKGEKMKFIPYELSDEDYARLLSWDGDISDTETLERKYPPAELDLAHIMFTKSVGFQNRFNGKQMLVHGTRVEDDRVFLGLDRRTDSYDPPCLIL